jgi:hypothetical protein
MGRGLTSQWDPNPSWYLDLQRQYMGPLWSWLYGSWIYNYLYNQFLSLWILFPLGQGVLDTTLIFICDEVCQLLAYGLWFSPFFSLPWYNWNIVALNTINPNHQWQGNYRYILISRAGSMIQCIHVLFQQIFVAIF